MGLRLTRFGTLFAGLVVLCMLAAASAQATHPRPKGASPTYMSLVPGTAPGGAPDTATVQDFTIEHSWACVQSGSTSTGSTCDLHTSLNTFMLDAVRDGKRGTWELAGAPIYDGGADGDTAADNTVFARPGVFIP